MSALLVLGLGLLLSRFGLEHADQLASVLSLGTAMFAVYQDRASKPRIRTRRWQKTAWGRRPLREDVQRLLNDTSKVTNRPPSSLLGDHSPEVDTVYVQQRVEQPPPAATHTSGRRRLSRFGDDELFLPFDQAPRVIPVRRPLEKVFDQHRHLLIEGGPGTGKSTMAGQICYQLARSWLVATPDGRRFSAEPLLPLFVTARALADHMDQSWRDALAGAVAKGFGLSSLYGVDPELLDGPVNGAEWLVVIDGLDEVPARDRETFLGRLSDWTSKSESPFRLLVTTRPLARHATALLGSGTVGHYTLLPFDRQALAKFANQWFAAQPDGPDLAAGFLSEVTAAGLYDVASVPLMATIAIRVYAGDPAAGLPRNRHDLYEEYLRWQRADSAPRRATAWSQVAAALRGKRADAEFAEDLNDRVDELLEVLAVERMATRRSLAVAATEWLHREVGPVAQRTSDDLMWLVTEALISTGLLSRRDAGPDFIHLTFAEHFAARRHAAELSESFDPEDGDWLKWLHGAVRSDPLAEAVLTRWTRDHRAEELLAWLLAGTRMHLSAAVRLVAEGASVTGDQLTACLAAVDHDLWAGRVTDPERILAPVRRFPAAPEVVQWLGRSFTPRRSTRSSGPHSPQCSQPATAHGAPS